MFHEPTQHRPLNYLYLHLHLIRLVKFYATSPSMTPQNQNQNPLKGREDSEDSSS
jgi:hypothetical protein